MQSGVVHIQLYLQRTDALESDRCLISVLCKFFEMTGFYATMKKCILENELS